MITVNFSKKTFKTKFGGYLSVKNLLYDESTNIQRFAFKDSNGNEGFFEIRYKDGEEFVFIRKLSENDNGFEISIKSMFDAAYQIANKLMTTKSSQKNKILSSLNKNDIDDKMKFDIIVNFVYFTASGLDNIGLFIQKLKNNIDIKKIKRELNNIVDTNINKEGKDIYQNIFENPRIEYTEKGLEIKTPRKTKILLGLYYAVLVLTPLIFIFSYAYRRIKSAKDYSIAIKAENLLNAQLFKKQKENDSAFEDYIELINAIKSTILDKRRTGLLIYGPSGTGKSYAVRRVLYFLGLKSGRDYIITKGSTSDLYSLYYLLYEYKDKIIILDDFDSALKDQEAMNLIKAATDTYPVRILSFPIGKIVKTSGGEGSAAPSRFQFKGKIIMITNFKEEQIDPALFSRIGSFEVKFDSNKIIDVMRKILKFMGPSSLPDEQKNEVFDLLIKLKDKYKCRIDLRDLNYGLDLRYSFPEKWEEILESRMKKKPKEASILRKS